MIKYLPNFLSIVRLVISVPLLMVACWHQRVWFLVLLVIGKITDVLDGMIARKYNCTSELGSKLDSYADIAFDLSSFASFFVVEPLVYRGYELYWFLAFGSLALAWVVGLLTTGRLVILHLYTNKLFGVLYTTYLFLSVIWPPVYWILYLSVLAGIIASMEQVAIFVKYGKSVDVERVSFWE